MAQGKPRDERKERQWRGWLQEWRASRLSVRAFCERRGLAEHTFYAWRRELDRRAGARTAFVPVEVVAAPAASAALELVLSGGRTLRVAAGFDAATLRQLLAVLEEVRPC
jgi:transposase-like protein